MGASWMLFCLPFVAIALPMEVISPKANQEATIRRSEDDVPCVTCELNASFWRPGRWSSE